MRISWINPRLLETITPKQKRLWDQGKFVVLPIVHSVRKATDEDFEIMKKHYPDEKPMKHNPSFIPIVWNNKGGLK